MPARSSSDLTIAETAKIIKAALAKAFPGMAFSVRSSSFSGGQDISIRWTDGPAESRVRKIAGPYSRVARDYMSGEILSGGRYLGLNREFSLARLAWAKNMVIGSHDPGDEDYRLLDRTSFDVPHKGDSRTSSR